MELVKEKNVEEYKSERVTEWKSEVVPEAVSGRERGKAAKDSLRENEIGFAINSHICED